MATPRVITVSQLRSAYLDETWRRRWLAGENPPTIVRRGRSEFPVQGVLFHTLAWRFADWLTGAAREPTTDGVGLWKELYERFAGRELERLSVEGAVPSANHLAKALQSFCRRLAELRAAAGENFRSWQDVFITQEYELKEVKVETAHGTMRISGRPDAVRHVFGAGIEIVDYKLSRGSSLKEDLIQVAAYAHLLRVVKPGLRFAGVLEYYEPGLHVTAVSEDELDGIWEDVIAPVLEELAAGHESRGRARMKAG